MPLPSAHWEKVGGGFVTRKASVCQRHRAFVFLWWPMDTAGRRFSGMNLKSDLGAFLPLWWVLLGPRWLRFDPFCVEGGSLEGRAQWQGLPPPRGKVGASLSLGLSYLRHQKG